MSYPKNLLASCLNILSQNNVRYALVGGFAVGLYSSIRTTKDIDFSICVNNDSQAEDVIKLFTSSGYNLVELFERKSLGRIAGVGLLSPFTKLDDPDLDLLFLFSGVEQEIVDNVKILNLLEFTVNVIDLPYLIALKCLSASEHRLQDEIDLQELIPVSDENTNNKVFEILKLISDRGFDDSIDLVSKYHLYLEKYFRK